MTCSILPVRMSSQFRWILAMATGAMLALGSASVFANAGVGLAANFPVSTTAGATNVPANLDFTNVSTPTTLTITVNTITLTPSCAAYTGLSCTTPDNGVFAISSTGTGRTGTACAGLNFTFTPHPGATDGTLDVTPSATIHLQVPGAPNDGDECIIDFTFDVLKAPAIDAAPDAGHPGIQTLPSGVVTGTASDSSTALGFGSTFITVQQATPGISTTASGAVTAGGSISDTATLSGGINPTGTITFKLYGPNDATCSTTPVFTTTKVVSGNGSYTSAAFTATAAGTYRWVASYGGDGNNIATSDSCNDGGESVGVGSASPDIATAASAAVKVGAIISDTALLSGGSTPTGTITFSLYGPNDAACSSTAIFTTTKAVSGNGTYTSATFTPTAVGTYRWIAVYSGDGSNNAAAGACNDANEQVVVSQATPGIATTASAGGIVGVALTDTATVSGSVGATGSITFRLYGPNDATCTTLAFTSNAITVSGNGNYTSTPTFTPTLVGTYRWIASYSGDANNAAVAGTCGAANESATISKATPAIATTASAGGTIGTALSDQATLSAGVNPTGTITFSLYGPNDATCSTTPVFTATGITVNGNGTYGSGSFTTTAAGTYRWRASYSGDADNSAVSGACNAANESATITKTTPTIATTASAGGAIGTALSDSAALAGGSSPTGTITFSLYGPNDATCSTTPVFTSAGITVNGNGTYGSGAFTTTAAGTYRWRASYSGDANNVAVSGACNAANESATITQTTPTIATTASAAIKLGASVTDTATLSAGTNPTGSITFRLYGPNDATCSTLVFTSTAVTVSGNGAYTSTPTFTPTLVGTYRWVASYGGDSNNVAVAGACGATGESVVVSQATPSIATAASAGGALGIALSDHATLSAGVNPTGTLTFTLYGPNDATCSTTPVFTSSGVTVNGNATYASSSFTPTLVGTYRWRAAYSGDAGNGAVSGACNDTGESATVTTASPALATTASAAIKLGGTVTDTATLSGGVNPTGSITFRLYGPNDATCTTLAFTSSAVTVNGNGSYTSAPAFTPTAVGTYRWIASYSGDAGNGAVAGACGATGESVTVNQATPAIVTSASAGGLIGTAVSDTATLSAGANPTGSITFKLYGPDDASCGSAPAYVSAAVTVTGNGPYTSPTFTTTLAGTYRWVAAYSGDTANAAVAGACNDANESVVITGSAPTLVTQTAGSVALGTVVHDTATLAGGTNPTGTITFNLYGPNDAACSNASIFTTTATVNGNGAYPSSTFKPTATGTYRWIAAYGGDTNNVAITGACNDANESVTVSAPPPGVTSVPTLSQWGLLLLGMLLALLGGSAALTRRASGSR